MNDTPENGNAAGTTPGEQLKQAREKAGLSVERVAKDLYLDTQVINAIEVNHFNDLGAPVYAKGYLRKYARLVGLTEEDVLRHYQQMGGIPAVQDPIPAAMGTVPETRRPLPRWIGWMVVALLVLAGVATLLNLRDKSNDDIAQGELISQPLSASAPGSTAVADSPLSVGIPIPPSPSMLTVRFNFSGDSSVEVQDANNQQVLYDMGTANGSREIQAVPPLRVVLGVATAVNLQVNSRAVSVPAKNINAGTARFVIKADGSLE